uniref:VWFA domain-containing protein n=1 Tax=Arcella intermedia TaxID=1963864 RepID=A0A6B2KXX6_9EUKA
MCGLLNEVPVDYFSPLTSSGVRQDLAERAELTCGAIEFTAPNEYMVRPPQPPVYFFVIDVSCSAVTNGQLQIVSETILRCLDGLPGDQSTRVGFLTFDSKCHFYNLRATSTKPQMMVMSATEKIAIPSGYDFLVHLKDCKTVITNLLTDLPKMFQGNQDNRSCLGTALKAAQHIQKPIGGKMLLFTSNLPSVGLGVLPNRFDPKLLNTPKEILLVRAQNEYYKKFALQCSKKQIGVDVFAFARDAQFLDVANLGQLTELTGGQMHYYHNFQGYGTLDSHKFAMDLFTDLTRETGFEAVMRVRCSHGISVQNHLGNFFLRSTDLLALPNIDPSKAFGVTFTINEDLGPLISTIGPFVTIQAALLYTTTNSERRIRVLTTVLPITNDLNLIYKGMDVNAIVNINMKLSIQKALASGITEARDAIPNRLLETMVGYKMNFGNSTPTDPVPLPVSLKVFPLYTLAALKSVLFRTSVNVHPDLRAYYFQLFRFLPVEAGCLFLYPKLFALHNLDPYSGLLSEEGIVYLPPALNLSSEHLSRNGIFLMDNGQSLLMRICAEVDPQLLTELFGTTDLSQIPLHQMVIQPNPELPADCALNRIGNIIQAIQSDPDRYFYPRLHIFRDKEALDVTFLSAMIEDKYSNGQSYHEFLLTLTRQVSEKIK